MVVIHHLPGWDEWIIEVTRKFAHHGAHHGYVAVASHLYFRDRPGDPDDVGARVRAAGGSRTVRGPHLTRNGLGRHPGRR
jgi:carboxymethylenebutenolidase